MTTRHVVVRYGFGEWIEMIRDAAPDGVEVHFPESQEAFEELLGEAEGMFGHLEEALFDQALRLQWLQNNSTGVDVLDYPKMRESDIVVTGISGLLAPPVAEHAVALLLSLSRGLGPLRDLQRAREWKVIPGRELGGLTACILGVGAIGRKIASYLKPFGVHVVGLDAQPMEAPDAIEEVYLMDQLPTVLASSDVLIICCPLTDQTYHLIDGVALAQLKADAFVINVARGGIVDEAALVDALDSGHLGGAALDVTEQEPYPADGPLWDAPRLLLTPHSAGHSPFTLPRKRDRFIDNMRRWAAGESLIDMLSITAAGRS